MPTDGRGWQAAYFGLAFTPRDWWVGLAGETAGPAPAVNCDEEDLQRSWERAGTVATRITASRGGIIFSMVIMALFFR